MLARWNSLLRIVPIIFERLDSVHDMFWRSVNLRELARGIYGACVRTAFQRILEITMYRQVEELIKGKRTHVQVAKYYQKHATLSAQSETITENLVSQVHAIYTRAFCDKAVLGIVQDAETRCGLNFPFDSVNKMYYLSIRVTDLADRSWLLSRINGMHQNGQLRNFAQGSLHQPS